MQYVDQLDQDTPRKLEKSKLTHISPKNANASFKVCLLARR